MNILIRRLDNQDARALRALNQVFSETFNDAENYSANKPTIEYLNNFLSDQSHVVLVAENESHVVGGLVAYCLTKFESERKEIYVYDLAVNGKFQRQGIGRKLLDELKIVARQLGAYVIFLQADEGDEAIKFYEALNPSENSKTRNFDFPV